MKTSRPIRVLYYIAALYDGLLGLSFLLLPSFLFRQFAVTPPNHYGYVHFPAALLVVFAVMFIAIARDPVGKRHMIIYGILLKISYCGVAFWHWIATGIPGLWKPFAFVDLVFLVLFAASYRLLCRANAGS